MRMQKNNYQYFKNKQGFECLSGREHIKGFSYKNANYLSFTSVIFCTQLSTERYFADIFEKQLFIRWNHVFDEILHTHTENSLSRAKTIGDPLNITFLLTYVRMHAMVQSRLSSRISAQIIHYSDFGNLLKRFVI